MKEYNNDDFFMCNMEMKLIKVVKRCLKLYNKDEYSPIKYLQKLKTDS